MSCPVRPSWALGGPAKSSVALPSSLQASAAGRRICRHISHVVRAGGGDESKSPGGSAPQRSWWESLLDYESWAPRSSRMWRLNQYSYEASTRSDDESEAAAESLDDLESRLARQNRASTAASFAMAEAEAAELPAQGSFSDADDSLLFSSLSQRITQLAPQEEVEEPAPRELPLTAEELRLLVFKKYGKSYDLSIVRRDIPGKAFVCLNVMWSHLDQKSFKLTEEQYMEKLDSIAYLLNALEQAKLIRATLNAPAKSQNGMPSRPVVGTAVTIQLPVSQATIDEWFGRM